MAPRKDDKTKDKTKDKAKDADKTKDKDSTAVVSVNIDDFTRTRDSVIVSLATLQTAVADLSRAYINHANTILNRGAASLDLSTSTASLLENGILGNVAGAAAHHLQSGDQHHDHHINQQQQQDDEDQPKKKRKRVHDPNAPKRALTPFFLYMQTVRPEVGAELGKDAKPKDVSDECTRRWGNMSEGDKQVWRNLYADNLAIYQAKMKAYKAGAPVPENLDATEAAKQLQQGVQTAAAAETPRVEPGTDDEPASSEEEGGGGAAKQQQAETDSSSSSDESSASDEEASPVKKRKATPPQPRAPPPPPRSANKRGRAAGAATATPKAAAAAAPEPASTSAKKGSPDKKRKGKAAAAAEEKEKAEKAKRGAVETPKSDVKKKKKRKSGVASDE